MKKHVIDTDLYVDLIRTGENHSFIREIYENETPGIYFSSVVAQELLSGVQSALAKRLVWTILKPFERTGRIVTPSNKVWREAGNILSRIFRIHPEFKNKLPGLVNDGLLAASVRSIGATLYTRNREDFQMIRSVQPFSLVILGTAQK